MWVKLDENILKNILDEKYNIDEAALLINELIEKEFEKEEPDFNLIEEYSDALIEIQNGNAEAIEIPEFKVKDSKKRIKFSRTFIRIILIAAILLATTITANAAITGATGKGIIENISIAVSNDKKEEKETTSQTTTKPYTTAKSKPKKQSNNKKKPKSKAKKKASFNEKIQVEPSKEETSEEDITAKAEITDEDSDNSDGENDDENVVTQIAEPDISYPDDNNGNED